MKQCHVAEEEDIAEVASLGTADDFLSRDVGFSEGDPPLDEDLAPATHLPQGLEEGRALLQE